MPDAGRWLMPLAAAGICAAGMAVLVAGIALALGTAGHDWYAAWKYTLAEAMLAVGFSDHGLVDYRTADGRILTVERYRLAHVMNEAWSARRLIFSLAADRAVLGACTGLALFGMWMGVQAAASLRRFAGERRRSSRAVIEPAPRVQPGYADRIYRPDHWTDEELVAALARRRGRLGVLLVPADEFERLTGAGGAAGLPATPPDPPVSLPPARTPGLSPPESAEPADGTAAPTKPAPGDSGTRPDTTKADQPTGDQPAGDKFVVPKRKLGEQFY
ncbi:MAG: hypothetical protein OXF51_04690 [Alphaproteobacteria bacterium]|nr:hypothetical protein [Alphaproteobacteria bacterium]